MSDSFTSDSDSDSYSLATPEGSTYTPEASTSSLDASVIEIPPATPSHDSALSSVSDSDSNNGGDAEEEWQESLRQLELLISMVIVPFFGKWVGRRTAYWTWGKFMTWKYPVDVVITDRRVFAIGGAISVVSAPL